MSFFADPDAFLEHNFQDHQVRGKNLVKRTMSMCNVHIVYGMTLSVFN